VGLYCVVTVSEIALFEPADPEPKIQGELGKTSPPRSGQSGSGYQLPGCLDTSLSSFSEQGFELGKSLLDRIEVGAVRRQKEELCAGGANGAALSILLIGETGKQLPPRWEISQDGSHLPRASERPGRRGANHQIGQ
jgi:hypothetical protein